MYCRICGQLLSHSDSFCIRCGTPTGVPASVPVQKKTPYGKIVGFVIGGVLLFSIIYALLLSLIMTPTPSKPTYFHYESNSSSNNLDDSSDNDGLKEELSDEKIDESDSSIISKTVREKSSENYKLRYGCVLIEDAWIYFYNDYDYDRLYRMRLDGTDLQNITTDQCQNIVIVKGWIYYSNGSNEGRLYKRRTDGSDAQRLSEKKVSDVTVVDDWIYYCCDIGSNSSQLWKIRTDGTDECFITECPDGKIYNLIAFKEHLFYVTYKESANKETKYELYKLSIADGIEQKVNANIIPYDIDEDYIYYFNDNGFFRMRLDGTESINVLSDETYMLFICDGWIYYRYYNGTHKLYKIRIDGTEKTNISPEKHNVDYLSGVIDGWIYFFSFTDENDEYVEQYILFRVRLDGTDCQIVGQYNI